MTTSQLHSPVIDLEARGREGWRPPAPATFSPDVELTALEVPAGRVHVVRDDLLLGGTKQRAAVPYLAELVAAGHREVVYASPFAGFAQVALASSARHLGLACTLFCEQDQARPEAPGQPHAFSRLAESLGARLVLLPTLDEAERAAAIHAAAGPGAFKIPLGFNAPSFLAHLERELRRQWPLVVAWLGAAPRTLWLPVGSGTLASAFRGVVPEETALRCVDVRVLDPQDPRLQRLVRRPGIRLAAAAEPFSRVAVTPPPVPSNAHYDAKLWAFLLAEGQDGDVWWNVAR